MPSNFALTAEAAPLKVGRKNVGDDYVLVLIMSAFAYKLCSAAPRRLLTGVVSAACGLGVNLAVNFVAPAVGASARHGETAVTCTNPASGATWQIRIDYDRGTVDSNPASIGDAAISWRDASDGWSYTLDRKTGNLTAIVASATGGNFLHDRCALED
jgi:hypothetical protein